MMVRDALRVQGEALFRIRGYVPLLLAPAFFFALRDSEWVELAYGDRIDDLVDWLCLGLSASGVMLRVATVGFVPHRTSGRNARKGQVADELNTTGMYSVVRHPLYVANSLILIGFLLATHSFWLTALGILACCLHYERVACAEEAFLLERFGARYRAWADRTPGFVPRPSLWVRPAQPFCWRTALRREYTTAFALVLAYTVLDYVEDVLAVGRVEIEPEMTALFVFALAAFAAIRTLHKRTRLLHVRGR